MFNIGLATKALVGETVCGDQAGFWLLSEHQVLLCLADGLGHGKQAYQAAYQCLSVVASYRQLPVNEILGRCNRALRGTRGVAMALVKIDRLKQCLKFIGVGNITVCIAADHLQRLISCAGIVGNESSLASNIISLPFIPGTHTVFLSSDGMSEQLPYLQYRQTLYPDPHSLASELMEDWSSVTDDAALMICR